MQRDRDRLTTTDLEAARRELEGEPLRDLRYALKRLREWDPPDPEDAVRWAVQEAIALETGWKVWGDRTPGSSLPRRPQVLEVLVLRALEAIVERSGGRFLTFLDPLFDHVEELTEQVGQVHPLPPDLATRPEGAGVRVQAVVMYLATREALKRGQGTVGGVLDVASEEGMGDDEALWWLRVLRSEGFVDLEGKDKVPAEASVAVFEGD